MDQFSEHSRLAALHRYQILDTPPEESFDDIVTLATHICDAPVGLISLVDENRQWFKARIGFAPCETPLSQSVCAHAIRQQDVLIIPDLTKDPRTRDNTLVTAEPHIRFYAGAVLRTSAGEAMGTLCVIDGKPRPDGLSVGQITALEALARQVVSQMELRKAVAQRDAALTDVDEIRQALAISGERYRLSTSATRSVIWDWDRASRHIHWDESLSRVHGHELELVEPTRNWWLAQIHPDDRAYVIETSSAAITGNASHWEAEYRFRRGDDSYATVLNKGIVVRDRAGRATRMTGVMLDISDRAEAEERQTLINLELSHRLKNTLAMVQAIAGQTLRNAESLDAARDALSHRLVALGKAHDILLVGKAERAGMEAIIRGALASHDDKKARVRVHGPMVEIGPRSALALALMIHELGTNAVKYGALSNSTGNITVEWWIVEENATPYLKMLWEERDGPPVITPTKLGFGSRMIERALAGTIGSKVTTTYAAAGVVCNLVTPLAGFQEKDHG